MSDPCHSGDLPGGQDSGLAADDALAFAAGLGGIITLVGTPPNIIAAGALKAAGLRPFGFFEFAWIGIPLTIAGLIYMLTIGWRLLPKSRFLLTA